MNIAIAVSGTGGHIYPGISLAKKIISRGQNVVFFCNKNKLSKKILISSSLEISDMVKLDFFGKKKGIFFLVFIFKLIKSFFYSLYCLNTRNIDVVVGMGGYLSFPVVLAGKCLNKKVIIHEQNYYPGLANKILNFFADKTAISFLDTKKYFHCKKNVFFTGNPIREDFYRPISQEEARIKLKIPLNRKVIFVFGGSQGATFLNNLPKYHIFDLAKKKYDLFIIHITGDKDFEMVFNEYAKQKIDSLVLKYFNNIHLMYFASDIVISRSGASSVTEILLSKKPAILFPYSHATSDHQTKNAYFLEELKIAKIRQEKNFNLEKQNIMEDIINFLDEDCKKLFSNNFEENNKYINMDFAQNLYNIIF